MADYEFTLKYAVPERLAVSEIERRLLAADCDDALPGTGQPGRLALAFTRSAPSAKRAVSSAIRAVARALPEATLMEAGPDLVGVTDVAALFGFSRQYLLKLIGQHRDSFPLPLHEGKASLWHLSDVLTWLVTEQGREVEKHLIDVAGLTRALNLSRELKNLAPELKQHLSA